MDGCNNTANLGSLVRTSTAFGVQAIMLSSTCCDCWYRKAVRVSMGHIFSMPVIRVDNLAETLRQLRFTHCDAQLWGLIDMDDFDAGTSNRRHRSGGAQWSRMTMTSRSRKSEEMRATIWFERIWRLESILSPSPSRPASFLRGSGARRRRRGHGEFKFFFFFFVYVFAIFFCEGLEGFFLSLCNVLRI